MIHLSNIYTYKSGCNPKQKWRRACYSRIFYGLLGASWVHTTYTSGDINKRSFGGVFQVKRVEYIFVNQYIANVGI